MIKKSVVIPMMEDSPFMAVVKSDRTVGIFKVEGGSVCNDKRLEVSSYVAMDLPTSRGGSTRHVHPQKIAHLDRGQPSYLRQEIAASKQAEFRAR
jgi:hypothetical protein